MDGWWIRIREFGQSKTLALLASHQQEGTMLAAWPMPSVTTSFLDVLHRVEDRESGRIEPPGELDVQVDVLLRSSHCSKTASAQ